MSIPYLAATVWRLENMTESDHRAAEEAAGRATSGLSRRVRRTLATVTARRRRTAPRTVPGSIGVE